MEPRKKKVDYFGTFLESVKSSAAQQAPAGSRLKTLLSILAGSGPTKVPDLMKESGLGLEDFIEAINTMRKLDLITVEGQPGEELVRLTPQGEMAVPLAQ